MNNPPLRIGIIGGSGLGQALDTETGTTEYPDTPFGKPSAPITLTKWEGVEIALLPRHGVGHLYPPSFVPYRANIYAMKMLGVTHIIASGATGSLREHMRPGDLSIVDQVIDKTFRRVNTFYERAAVHIEFSQPFCPLMRLWLLQAARSIGHVVSAPAPDAPPPPPGTGIRIHDRGTYICMEGPAFSTIAESHMHRAWGGDLIGMTVMPEAKLAREAEIAYALIGLPTDYDCWRPHDSSKGQQELLKEIIGNLQRASEAGIALIKAALADIRLLQEKPSLAHTALQLAIWSDKSRIDAAEIARMRPLWGKYFPQE